MEPIVRTIYPVLRIPYPKMTPSVNRIYVHTPRGTYLTKEAKQWKSDFVEFVAQNFGPEISQLDRLAPYGLHILCYFDSLITKAYLEPELDLGQNEGKTGYKRLDVTNRIKFLEDCVKTATAIDDCQNFASSQEKHMDPGNERLEILLHEVDPTWFGLPRRKTVK